MIALRDKIAHNRTGYPTDNMHYDRRGFSRITGKNKPSNMVDSHSDNGNQFNYIRIKNPKITSHYTPYLICHRQINQKLFPNIQSNNTNPLSMIRHRFGKAILKTDNSIITLQIYNCRI